MGFQEAFNGLVDFASIPSSFYFRKEHIIGMMILVIFAALCFAWKVIVSTNSGNPAIKFLS